MEIIYEPKGRAKEYSDLACNTHVGCTHRCLYCYGPSSVQRKREEFMNGPKPKKDIIAKFEKDARKIQGDPRPILFSFATDPYCNEEISAFTSECLLICEKYKLNPQVLTKAGLAGIAQDGQLLKKNNWKFGQTICFMSEDLRKRWEPGASPIETRIHAAMHAHNMGIYNWVSVEPVIDPIEALRVIEGLKPYVDFWKIGKINYNKKIEDSINWPAFLMKVEQVLQGCDYLIKKDLEAYRNA